MNADGRKGKVFSIRLDDATRVLIQEAIAAEAKRRDDPRASDRDWWEILRWRHMSVGTFLRESAAERAKQLLEPGTTGGGPKPVVPSSSSKKKKGRRR